MTRSALLAAAVWSKERVARECRFLGDFRDNYPLLVVPLRCRSCSSQVIVQARWARLVRLGERTPLCNGCRRHLLGSSA